MGHGKETPRQKMIGMMYLFLTAMLALNVSKEVLDSFVKVNDSLAVTIENFNDKNQKIYSDFAKQEAINKQKVEKWSAIANEVKIKSDSLSNFIKDLKVLIVQTAEGPESPALAENDVLAELIAAKDDSNIGAQVLIGQADNQKGLELRQAIDAFRDFLLSHVGERDSLVKNSIIKNLDTSPPPPVEGRRMSWQAGMFEHIPLVAVITMLTKIQSDIRNAEADILRYLYAQIDQSDFKFNKLQGIAIPNSAMVVTGEEFSASIFVAAFDTTQSPQIYVGDYETLPDGGYRMKGNPSPLTIANGMGQFKTTSRRVGANEWGGLIMMKAPDGTEKQYPFKNTFQVTEPMAVISASANTVFYSGIENPLEVSVPGISMDKIYPSITNARLVKSRNGWNVTPTSSGGTVTITVAIEVGGRRQNVGKKDFRIRPVPPPTPKIAGKNGGNISVNDLAAGMGIIADLEGFIMENIKFVVDRFTVVVQQGIYVDEIQNRDWRFSNEVLNKIRSLKRGERITFENIVAKGPSGEQNLGAIVFKIN